MLCSCGKTMFRQPIGYFICPYHVDGVRTRSGANFDGTRIPFSVEPMQLISHEKLLSIIEGIQYEN